MQEWWNDVLASNAELVIDADVATLVQRALHAYEGQLSDAGALVIRTGIHTGRSPEDKYVVEDPYTSGRIDWASVKKIDARAYLNLRNQVRSYLNNHLRNIYVSERSVSAKSQFQLGIRLLTTHASAALFAKNLFRDPVDRPALGSFTVLHCPLLEIQPYSHNVAGPTVILINFGEREILIAGTQYLGEIKKAVFSVMNTLLPDFGVLPAHAGANSDEAGDVSVFFGLSGTGKTTLSTDLGRRMIGDDEHGIGPEGIFNLEGGCYAKTFHLSRDKEPQIYDAVNRFGTLIENVPLDRSHRLDFDSAVITENGRAAYPLSHLREVVSDSEGKLPSNIFFLSADAMGVLPAVSKLTIPQAYYFFLSGYTSKVSGTEMNLDGVKATFSHCFGAPFMLRKPQVYAQLLKELLERRKTTVWLINTGWYGGPYGVGRRYDLITTRSIIRAIQQGLDDTWAFQNETLFNLAVPTSIPGVAPSVLHPRSLWSDPRDYDQVSEKLRNLFLGNFKKFGSESVAQDLLH